jgi:hypothetical protein
VAKKDRFPPGSFPVVRISAAAVEFVEEFQQAVEWMRDAVTPQEVERAYVALSIARKALYEHLAVLEAECNRPRSVTFRF